MIDAQAEAALTSDSFTDVDFTTLRAILERESLNCKETVVFRSAMRWAVEECKRRGKNAPPTVTAEAMRDILGDAIKGWDSPKLISQKMYAYNFGTFPQIPTMQPVIPTL